MNNVGYSEPALTNAALSDLVKIPTKDFEEKFREWMERDEVTRSLQAKLRRDLIANFNKTALGRHIMSQTTMTTNGVFGGGKTQRLTLSPVVLALNTLVAEFLYAENCHYTLSVFCTEVPFRNTLPDFDERTPFRFANTEVNELLGALAGSKAVEQQLKENITAKYTDSNSSLLFLVLDYLLTNLEAKNLHKNIEHKSTMTKVEKTNSPNVASKNDEMHQLNKYLLMLSRKMETLLQQCHAMPTAKTFCNRRGRVKKPKSMNRSLDQLKKLTQEKMYNKQIRAVLTAINKLGNQFENCANNFAQIYEDTTKLKDESNTHNTATHRQIATQTDEKGYSDWMHEVRSTRHGRKFLNRLEGTFMKALRAQKEKHDLEINEKLEQQKALLKIRYRQKLIDHMSRPATAPIDEVITEMQRQLTDLHVEYNQLLQKLQEKEQAQNQRKANAEEPNEKEIHKIMQDMQLEDTNVDNLLEDAKQQLMALDEENQQIEQQVSTCLALLGKPTLPQVKPLDVGRESAIIEHLTPTVVNESIETSEEDELKNLVVEKPKSNKQYAKEIQLLKFENAMANAKKEFFEKEEKRKKQMLSFENQLAKEDQLLNEKLDQNAENLRSTLILKKSADKLNRLFAQQQQQQDVDRTFIRET